MIISISPETAEFANQYRKWWPPGAVIEENTFSAYSDIIYIFKYIE